MLDVAGLGHEAVDDAVEDDAVVEAFARERLDALDVAGGEVGAQADHHAALARENGPDRLFEIIVDKSGQASN